MNGETDRCSEALPFSTGTCSKPEQSIKFLLGPLFTIFSSKRLEQSISPVFGKGIPTEAALRTWTTFNL